MGLFEHFPYTNFHDLNLDWILKTVKDLYHQVSEQAEWIENHQKEYEELKAIYDQIVAGNFPPELIEAFEKWMRYNALDLVGELVKMVFFGITADGYFVAYIPESWDDIIFNTTGLDIDIEGYDYGHLVLSMEIGGN